MRFPPFLFGFLLHIGLAFLRAGIGTWNVYCLHAYLHIYAHIIALPGVVIGEVRIDFVMYISSSVDRFLFVTWMVIVQRCIM